MMRLAVAVLCMCAMLVSPVSADWRWADPAVKKVKPNVLCHTIKCKKKAKHIAKLKFKLRVARYSYAKEREWTRWTNRFVPDCIWYGESGVGPEYARYRYTMPNSTGSGAWGKFQFMSGTYHTRAKYHDWSPLDQEIAARREYWAHGTAPWANCH